MLESVIKRDWRIERFEKVKILNAISRALKELEENKYSNVLIEQITENIYENLRWDFIDSTKIPTVDDIETVVEHFLMNIKAYDLAKAYILKSDEKRKKYEEYKEKNLEKLKNDSLYVTKTNWKKELFDISKVRKLFNRANINYKADCKFTDISKEFKWMLINEIKTSDITKLLIKVSVDKISTENTKWQYVAWRIAMFDLYKKASRNRNLTFKELYTPKAYKDLVDKYIKKGLYYKDFYNYYTEEDILEAWKYLSKDTDLEYNYTTLTMLGKRYLLNPNKVVNELPQEMYMWVALFLAIPEPKEVRLKRALEIYDVTSTQKLSLATPTLMNARTNFSQLSSCFVLNSGDDLREIYHNVENIAQISKLGGWVWIYLWNIRSKWASIRWIEWASRWVLPWNKVINDTAIAVDQLGQRAWAVSVTLDIWHKDIYDFLDMQTETWDIRRKSFDVFPAISVPDLFMKRVDENWLWTVFDPKEVEDKEGLKLQDFFWKEFEDKYIELESKKDKFRLAETYKAKDLFKRYMKSVVETWMPYMFFRDTNNTLNPNNHAWMIYSSQLCTEIAQNTSPAEYVTETYENWEINIKYKPWDSVVCNLASINVAKVNTPEEIERVTPLAMRVLDNVIDLNLYPIKESELTAMKYRSVWLGYLGLAEYFAVNKIAYDSPKAAEITDKLFEKYSYETIKASKDLAIERWAYELFEGSKWSKWILIWKNKQWFTKNSEMSEKWIELIDEVKKHWVRNGYMMSPAPNTSTANIVGTTAWLLPVYKRYFVETNSIAPMVNVAPNLSTENFWYYKEYVSMNVSDVINVIANVQKWIDQSISFEWLMNPQKTSPKDVYDWYFKAWRSWIKTVYYVRSQSLEIKECVSCSW